MLRASMSDARTVELVRLAKAGDREALEAVLGRYYDRVQRAVRIRMGDRVRSWTDSVDIMTRTFMKALEKFDAFEMRNDSSLLRWLVTIAEGMIRDAADERNAKKRDPDRESPIERTSAAGTAVQVPLADPATTITSQMGRNEDRDLVDRAIEALAPEDRELLVEHYYMDASFDEIAERAGLIAAGADLARRQQAADAVRKRAATARARLAILLQRLRGRGGGSGGGA